MSRLLKDTKLTFTRFGAGGGRDEFGDGIEGTTSSLPDIEGSLQPVGFGERRNLLPEGKSSDSVYKFYTKTELNTADQFTDTQADETTIGSHVYFVMDSGDHTMSSRIKVRHYEVILVRKGLGHDN